MRILDKNGSPVVKPKEKVPGGINLLSRCRGYPVGRGCPANRGISDRVDDFHHFIPMFDVLAKGKKLVNLLPKPFFIDLGGRGKI